MLRAVKNAADFLIDEALGVFQLGADVGDEGMARAVFAREISFVLGDIRVLRAQLGNHVRRNGRVDAAGIAAGFG